MLRLLLRLRISTDDNRRKLEIRKSKVKYNTEQTSIYSESTYFLNNLI